MKINYPFVTPVVLFFIFLVTLFLFIHVKTSSQIETLNSNETIISAAREQLNIIKERVESTPYDDLVFEFPSSPVYIKGYDSPKFFTFDPAFVLSYRVFLGEEKFLDDNTKERLVTIHVIAKIGWADRDFESTILVRSNPLEVDN